MPRRCWSSLLVIAGLAAAAVAQDPLVRLSRLLPAPVQSWPVPTTLVLQVELTHPADVDDAADTAAIVLAPAAAAFAPRVMLTATDADGDELAWTFTRSARSDDGPLLLRRGSPVRLGFALAADPARRLATATCSVRATLANLDGAGWRGRVSSEPLTIPTIVAAATVGSLEVTLVGGATLTAGELAVVAIDLPPPVTDGVDALRNGFALRWRDAAGRVLPLAAECIAMPPTDDASERREAGFGPVLVVFPAAVTATLTAGDYALEVEHGSAPSLRRGHLACHVVAAVGKSAEPAGAAVLLAAAQARLWCAEVGNSAEMERQTAAAVGLLRTAERAALAAFAASPQDAGAAATLAEICWRLDDHDAAGAFARVALGLWQPPPVDGEQPAPAPPPELRSLAAAIEAGRAAVSVRVLPYLRLALAKAPTAAPEPTADGVLRQWASAARASSQYRSTDYSAAQAVGAPDVAKAGDSAKAWAPKQADDGEQWLDVTFAQPVQPKQLRVVQNCGPGAIVRIEAITDDGAAAVLWTGPDPTVYPPSKIAVLEAPLAASVAPVARLRLVLDTARVAGWNEIDAVELIGEVVGQVGAGR